MKIESVVLKGGRVTLEPLGLDHIEPLCEFGLDPELWQLTANQVFSGSDMADYVQSALDDRNRGTALPFVTKLTDGGKVVGSTRFGNIDVANRKTEIGWTWLDPQWQQSFINREAKLLMLTHAFEVWGCIRVEFKTDILN